MPPDQTIRVMIPVKAFERAKERLGEVLDPSERQRLARAMAEEVIRAAEGLPTTVICDDTAVAEWAQSLGVQVEWTPGLGLNGAVQEATKRAADDGVDRVIIVHSDLPFAPPLSPFTEADTDEVVIVPDRHGRGTNLLSVPTRPEFTFSYGSNSFAVHQQEAEMLSLEFSVVGSEALGWDIDEPADLLVPTTLSSRSPTFPDGLLRYARSSPVPPTTAAPGVDR